MRCPYCDQETELQLHTVHYVYGTYSGTWRVWAEGPDAAIAKVKRELQPHMTLPMACESYRVE